MSKYRKERLRAIVGRYGSAWDNYQIQTHSERRTSLWARDHGYVAVEMVSAPGRGRMARYTLTLKGSELLTPTT